jgi:hypothetical protein
MKNKLTILATLFSLNFGLNAYAHPGHSHQPRSVFSGHTDKKFSIDSGEGHIGHFHIRRIQAKKRAETLRIRQTFHYENDITKVVNANYNKASNQLQYRVNLPEIKTTQFIFINLENLDGSENLGHRIIINNETGVSTAEAITLKLIGEDHHHHH